MQGKISASIVIYKNDPLLLDRAVASFLDSTTDSTLYLIDNSPSDALRHRFAHPRVQYIFNNKNIGFGPGHNIALRKALQQENEFHLILNPDVYFDKGVVAKLLDYMRFNTQVGLIMPKVLYPDGRLQPLCKLLPSPVTLFSRRFLKFNSNLLNRMNHWYEMHFTGYNTVMDVPFLSGCFMFLRMETIRKVGLFDETIFLYTEDTDLTRRIHKHYRTIFYPEASIYHHNQRGSYKNFTILIHHVVSAIRYFNKWGWFSDRERDHINQRILLKFSSE
ncbi:MAG TPA: glycosyltransferase family 2 protein [Chryseosolibacter sp.]